MRKLFDCSFDVLYDSSKAVNVESRQFSRKIMWDYGNVSKVTGAVVAGAVAVVSGNKLLIK